LPGLIIKAYDASKLYNFDLIYIKEISSNKMIQPWAKNAKITTRKKFLEELYKYLTKLDINVRTEFGINSTNFKRNSRRYRIGLENDYRHD
jgi:hypothetical protein